MSWLSSIAPWSGTARAQANDGVAPASEAPAPPPPPEAEPPDGAPPPTDPPSEPPDPVGGDELRLEDVGKGVAQEALNQETKVASSTAQRLRDSPGVVTVVSRDEIRRLGARDLMDVLHLVPGFSFGVDVQGSVGPIFRGVWGQEGKVLVLWDGFEINELMYLTAPIENHFPVQSIERIEVIRGPGSALYGGYAELAVINIVSRQASTAGFEVAGAYGQMWRGFGRANGELVYGSTVDEGALAGLEAWVTVFGGEASRSDRYYNDGYDSPGYLMTWENARQGPTWLNAGVRWRGLQFSTLIDAFRVAQRDSYDVSLPAAVNNSFYAAHLDVSYTLKVGELLELAPRVNVKHQLPWFSGGLLLEYTPSDELYYKYADRLRVVVPLRFFLFDGVVATVGADGYGDVASVVLNGSGGYDGINGPFQNDEPVITYWNVGAFAEVSVNSDIANLTAGARYEFHSSAGGSFVPRFALTKDFGPFWAKGLVSGAFKPPGIENVALNPTIVPENATVYEAEVGYDITPTITLSGSVFRIELSKPIVYFYDSESDSEAYLNFDRTGSQGAEAELRLIEDWGSITTNYSFTSSAGINNVSLYETPVLGALRGVPAHKITFAGRLNVSGNLSVGPTLIAMSERLGWLGAVDNAVGAEPPMLLSSLSLNYRDLLFEGIDATLAVHNIFDTRYRYVQPYDGGHMPLPAPGREIYGRLSYRFGP